MATKVTQIKNNKTVNKVEKTEVIKYPCYKDDYGDKYTLPELLNDIEYNTVYIKYQLSAKEAYDINFRITSNEYCCGLEDIGNFSCSKGFPIEELSNIFDTLIYVNNTRTYEMTTNGVSDCIPIEAALAKCKYWTLVKTYKSPNSKNTIKLWVSNN